MIEEFNVDSEAECDQLNLAHEKYIVQVSGTSFLSVCRRLK